MKTVPKASLEKATSLITLPLASGVKLKVSKNQKVQEGQVIAQRKASSQVKSYHLAKLIEVPPSKAIEFLVKKIGQKVKEGELVARKKNFLKPDERFIAPINGTLDSLTDDGILRIRKEISEKEMKAPFSGRVTEISQSSIGLSFAAFEAKGSWGSGKRVIGYLFIAEGEDQGLFSLSDSYKKRIIAFQGNLSKGLWFKAASLGALGFIISGSIEESLKRMIETEEDSLSLVILGEDDKINQEIWKELKKADGGAILVDGKQKRILIPKQ